MVVRDVLGREQVIVQQYYAARTLLRHGLDDFSYEFGKQRLNFTSANNDYGQWMLAATRRHGVTDRLTAEVHGEIRPGSQSLGLAATALWPSVGVIDVALATSHSGAGGGALAMLGFEHQAPRFNVGVRTQVTSARFDQLGLAPGFPAPLRQSNAHAGWNDPRFGSLGLGYLSLARRGQVESRLASLSYNRNLLMNWNLNASGFKTLQGRSEYSLSITLSHAFGQRGSAIISASRNKGANSAIAQYQQNSPIGSGVGYRVLASRDSNTRVEGALNTKHALNTIRAYK